MSIALFIGYRDSHKEDRLIPIASQESFTRLWKPLCAAMNLRWVPRFQGGWQLTCSDFPYLIAEFRRLERHLLDHMSPDEASVQMLARLGILTRELQAIAHDINALAFVGSPFDSQRRSMAFINSEQVGDILYAAERRRQPRIPIPRVQAPLPTPPPTPARPAIDDERPQPIPAWQAILENI